jgi:hypothetical protein
VTEVGSPAEWRPWIRGVAPGLATRGIAGARRAAEILALAA